MGTLSLILLIVFGIVSVLLILLVALQDDGESGLGGVFGGSEGGSLFGAATSNVVIKITSVLAGLFIVLALVVAILSKNPSEDSLLKNTQDKAPQTQEQTAPWYSN